MGKDAPDSGSDRFLGIAASFRREADALEAVAFDTPGAPAGSIIRPSLSDMALRRLAYQGVRNDLLKIDRRLLHELTARLVEPGVVIRDVVPWLSECLGRPVGRSSVYRLQAHLRRALREMTDGEGREGGARGRAA